MQTWQIFNYAKEILTKEFMQRLYTRSYSLVQLWAADPDTNARTERNPIDRIKKMLKELEMAGRGDIARAAIDIMARPLGGRFEFFPKAKSDKGTVDGEAADALIALGDLTSKTRQFILDGRIDEDEFFDIEDSAREAKRQIDELLDVIHSERG